MICYFVTYQTYSDGIGNLLCQGNQTYTWYFSLIDSWNNTFFFDWAKDYALEFFFDSASNSDFCCAAVLRYHWTKLTWFKKNKLQQFSSANYFLDTNGEDSTLLFRVPTQRHRPSHCNFCKYLQHRFREQLMTHSFSYNTKKHTQLHCIHITAYTH